MTREIIFTFCVEKNKNIFPPGGKFNKVNIILSFAIFISIDKKKYVRVEFISIFSGGRTYFIAVESHERLSSKFG